MGTPVAAHLDSVSVTATNVAATGTDLIAGLNDASHARAADMVDTNYLGSDGFKRRAATLRDNSLDISGHFHDGDAPQTVLRTAADSGATIYLTVIKNPAASAGSKGARIPMLVESYDEKFTPGSLVEFSCKLVGNGAPVSV